MPMLRLLPFSAIFAIVTPLQAKDLSGMPIDLPSGGKVMWQETRQDDSGGNGLTYRFRFVMPDLDGRAPMATAPASQDRGVLDTETGEVEGDEAALAAPQLADLTPADADDTTEAEADTAWDAAPQGGAGMTTEQDPLYDDMVWLCENWALARAAGEKPRPGQIVISLSDRETAFGAYNPDALQVFEAFRLPADRDVCIWEPW